MTKLLFAFLKSMFAWCMCDRRAPNAGENSPECVENHLNFMRYIFDAPIRCNAELKEVQNEVRTRGDVRLVTPRGPSASTIESLEKALQTVGITLCAVESVGFLFALRITLCALTLSFFSLRC